MSINRHKTSGALSRFYLERDLVFVEAVCEVNAANPFLPERIAAECKALGDEFVSEGAEWNTRPPTALRNPNVAAITKRCEDVIISVRERWQATSTSTESERARYEEVVGYWLYQTYAPRFDEVIAQSLEGKGSEGRVNFFPAFKADVARCFALSGYDLPRGWEPAHLFACAFQMRRAFHAIFHSLVGGSLPMATLRARIWQSIFTHDLRRYRQSLYARMGDFSTLIRGPSGTGKELVARALAWSRYLPFDPKTGKFASDFSLGFFPLNLAALSPTLIESELFGHRRGAFTGALSDRAGWMEVCPPTGAVFLDEIGDVDASIQVKLLRVLQARTFQPLGSTETRRFEGKVVAATNRDLPEEIRAGRFREDFFYRLCSDQLTTPSLREQLDAQPADLLTMISHVAARFLEAEDVPSFTKKALAWVDRVLGSAYPWPGNFRELEQCVRSLILRGEYQPSAPLEVSPLADWNRLLEPAVLTAEEVLGHYTAHVHGRLGTIEATARRLDQDRRTVKARLAHLNKATG
ncbi:MAG TPA: sigma 54-interacting transcriptional regulator [Opitutaceae bacterium]|nr:sigma 54-interacting transcriptional regulator [Opitutaceae bacterium]